MKDLKNEIEKNRNKKKTYKRGIIGVFIPRSRRWRVDEAGASSGWNSLKSRARPAAWEDDTRVKINTISDTVLATVHTN